MHIKQTNRKQLTPAPPMGHSSLGIVAQQQKQQRFPAHLLFQKGEKLSSNPVGPQELQVCLYRSAQSEDIVRTPLPFTEVNRCPLLPQKGGGRGSLLGGGEWGGRNWDFC